MPPRTGQPAGRHHQSTEESNHDQQRGHTPITITSITLTGTNAGDFAQVSNCPISPNTLGAGASCLIKVTFKPTAQGVRKAAVNINDDAAGSPQKVSLSGTGT